MEIGFFRSKAGGARGGVFKPAQGGDDGLWTVVGIFIAVVGLLFASVGTMLKSKQI